ncbi:cytochrome P450 [Streptomyces sp. NPDC101118]|uniref:cytochrome P450 n=1 Tax=Streptomyces sp. NPDC101118 TaxID=3366109 RepID=UPI00380AE340
MTDSTLSLLAQGYGWLPERRRRTGGGPVRTRLLGRPAVAVGGPGAVGFFYDERHVRRHAALPGPVLDTLFGRGAVHTLDGTPHRVRKGMFVRLLMDEARVRDLVERVDTLWSRELARAPGRPIAVFDTASQVLARAVCGWAGLPLSQRAVRRTARDCVAMVDGFATPGPRHWRARRARKRQEKQFARLVQGARAAAPRDGHAAPSVLEAVARHRDAEGRLLDPHTAAVELLNVVRPTVAIAWFAAFAAHALHAWPAEAARLRADGADGPGGAGGTDRTDRARAFAHEVRRYYPFAPFAAGRAATDLEWQGEHIPEGTLVLLDLYGQDHDPRTWHDPERFDPERFAGGPPDPDTLVPQGGGDPTTGHRCPGEDITIAVLTVLAARLAAQEYAVPDHQDLSIPLRRVPTRPRSGVVITPVTPAG